MPSTYTSNLRLTKQATGENTNTWGGIVNTQFELIEDAIAGQVSVSVGNSGYTLSESNGVSDEARNAIVVIKGAPTSNVGINFGAYSKNYTVRNKITTSVSLRLQVDGDVGSELKVPRDFIGIVYVDAVNVREVARSVNEQRLIPQGDGSGGLAIMMWSGEPQTIPTGWSLCDGTNGTPNLKDKFIIGYGSGATYATSVGVSNTSSYTQAITVDTSSAGNTVVSGVDTSFTIGVSNLPTGMYVNTVRRVGADVTTTLQIGSNNVVSDQGDVQGTDYKYRIAGTNGTPDSGRSSSIVGANDQPVSITSPNTSIGGHTHAVSANVSVPLPSFYVLCFIAYTG